MDSTFQLQLRSKLASSAFFARASRTEPQPNYAGHCRGILISKEYRYRDSS